MHYRSKWFFAAAGYIVCALLVPAQVLAQTPYYAGKTITIVRGGGPGGSGDFQARALMPFLTKHIPGNPHVVMEMMPGAAGRRAANHMFNTAKPDGLTISSAGGAVIPGPIIGLPGVKSTSTNLFTWALPRRVIPTSFTRAKRPDSINWKSCGALPSCGLGRIRWVIRSMLPRVFSRMSSSSKTRASLWDLPTPN